jgi:hypothetical protein
LSGNSEENIQLGALKHNWKDDVIMNIKIGKG